MKRRIQATAFCGVIVFGCAVLAQYTYWQSQERPQHAQVERYALSAEQAQAIREMQRGIDQFNRQEEEHYYKKLTPPGKEKLKPDSKGRS